MTDASRSIVWDASFLPFGEEDSLTGSAANDNRFPGQRLESETGLHYNYFRDYDPTTGRYLQSDPIGLAGGINTYGYVSGNPVNYVDPTGEIPLIPILVGAALGAGIDYAYQYYLYDGQTECIDLWEVFYSGVTGAIIPPVFKGFRYGTEIAIGRNFRIAPFGNRTGHPTGRYPHYHRRSTDPSTGETKPGQGIGRHRPWDKRSTDKSLKDRF